MALSDYDKKVASELIQVAREHAFKDEEIEILIMLCCSCQMRENFGEDTDAMKELTDFIKQGNDSPHTATKAVEMAGYNES